VRLATSCCMLTAVQSQQTNNIFHQLLIAVYLEEVSEEDETVDDTRSVVTAETDIDESVAQNRLKGDVDQKVCGSTHSYI
jgi:hypothetical protein